ncbi:hypothetical protein ACJZ2D_002544 [Fusarium nematophilum]
MDQSFQPDCEDVRDDEEAQARDQHQSKKRKTSTAADEPTGPACYSCRRKKAKCSREQPCSQCLRHDIECVYDEVRAKPGVRMGAIENLAQRLDRLENMFLGQSVLWQQMWKTLHPDDSDSGCSPSSQNPRPQSLQDQVDALRQTLAQLADASRQQPASSSAPNPIPAAIESTNDADQAFKLPPDDLVDSLVEIYFVQVHPWIPMLHVRQFRRMLAHPSQRRSIRTILHAIVSLCIRFSTDPRLDEAAHPGLRARYASQSRQAVILRSMESFSAENLRALIILAFDTIGSGRGPSAWSIVGSMTRTVEQLRLSVEDEDDDRYHARSLIRRMAFLPPSASWWEAEERRRIFWNVFLMDRFCSIATGWNLSLTSVDVRRRLPCEGALWEEGQPLKTPTPFFGVADQAYSASNSTLPATRPDSEEEQASLGGFAYCIEATESLSLVTSFFLQHKVDVNNLHDVQTWLVRFKQLDLRLVQWKIFLPEKWREACVLNADGIMDPNLTLAHITHNTAAVLLHQGIAYPAPEWQQAVPVRLPSSSSAETCLAAAVEVAVIADKFLQNSAILTNPQFAFCLFICGRMLLAHAGYFNKPLSPSFHSLVNSLSEMGRRWSGPHGSGSNLASRFAARLLQAHAEGAGSVDIRESAFSEKPAGVTTRSMSINGVVALQPQPDGQQPQQQYTSYQFPAAASQGFQPFVVPDTGMGGSPDSISLAFPPLPLSFQAHLASGPGTTAASPSNNQSDSIPLSQHANFCGILDGSDLQTFLDQSFLPDQRISMFRHTNALLDDATEQGGDASIF